MKHIIKEPFTKEKFAKLHSGDTVLLTGTIYSARDAAHKRMTEMIEDGIQLPFEIKDAILFYVGPTPAKPGYPSGSAGPTSSYRMDPYTPSLLKKGLLGMIGKGPRSENVKACAQEEGAVYFAAIGGAAALIAQCIKSSEVIAFAELGTEAIRKIEVENMPLVVAFDIFGKNIY